MLACTVATAHSQTFAGGERENYLRYLQTVRLVPLYPWGARAFSGRETDSLEAGLAAKGGEGRRRGDAHLEWLPIGLSARYNSTFPYGFNDGPIWAGKGFTMAMEGGLTWRRGVLSLTLYPLAFVAQNAPFPPSPDSSLQAIIDRPERFGNGTYARLDPGQSTLRIDWHGVALGVSTANEYWGPASDFPVILGNNAPGFPHLFAGTSRPVTLGPIGLHARVIWGRLSQSAFSAETLAAGIRLGTGIVVDLTTRWAPGLEIGATRFAHEPWRRGGPTLHDALAMFQASISDLRTTNELASVFFRWVLPHSGFEVYGEYGRDDYSSSLRSWLREPDRAGGYTVGLRKVFFDSGPTVRFIALRAEFQNLQLSSIARGLPWAPFYTHGYLRQGHTELGQVLGSEAGPGGAGSVIAVDSYSPAGRWTWSWTRILREQRGDPSGTPTDPKGVDVQHALAIERVENRGRYEVLASVAGVYEFNRDFTHDAFNLNVIVGARWLLF